MKTTNAVTAIARTNNTRVANVCNSPVLTSSSVPPTAAGKPATIPAKMIIDIPLPIPRSVTCSPSHIKNMVPVTNVTAAVKIKLTPGFITSGAAPIDWPCNAVEIPIA